MLFVIANQLFILFYFILSQEFGEIFPKNRKVSWIYTSIPIAQRELALNGDRFLEIVKLFFKMLFYPTKLILFYFSKFDNFFSIKSATLWQNLLFLFSTFWQNLAPDTMSCKYTKRGKDRVTVMLSEEITMVGNR